MIKIIGYIMLGLIFPTLFGIIFQLDYKFNNYLLGIKIGLSIDFIVIWMYLAIELINKTKNKIK